jgi:hypothetical protein
MQHKKENVQANNVLD